jgi:hypothetical protein
MLRDNSIDMNGVRTLMAIALPFFLLVVIVGYFLFSRWMGRDRSAENRRKSESSPPPKDRRRNLK